MPTNSHANCREFGSRVRSRKKNSIGALAVVVRLPSALLTSATTPLTLSPCHFLPGRVGFIGPGVRDSFIRRVFGPTFAFRTCSFRLRSRKDKRTNLISFMDHFVSRGKMTCGRGIYDTTPIRHQRGPCNCARLLHRCYTRRLLVYLSRASLAAMPIVTAANRARTLIVVYSARTSHVSLPMPRTLVG